MFNKEIAKMDFKELRNAVQVLYDAYETMRRNYEDAISNIDSSNFSEVLTKEYGDMKAQITVSANKIETMVADLDNYSTIEQTAASIKSTVTQPYVTNLLGDLYETSDNAGKQYALLQSQITQTAGEITATVEATYETKEDAESNYEDLYSELSLTADDISLIVSGEYNGGIFNNQSAASGIVISKTAVKMFNNFGYSLYNENGLRFYDTTMPAEGDQIEGWALEPSDIGGLLTFYLNNTPLWSFGRSAGEKALTLKPLANSDNSFKVDMTNGASYKIIEFVGLDNDNADETSPMIYANEKLLATQDWVTENAGSSGTAVAVFG